MSLFRNDLPVPVSQEMPDDLKWGIVRDNFDTVWQKLSSTQSENITLSGNISGITNLTTKLNSQLEATIDLQNSLFAEIQRAQFFERADAPLYFVDRAISLSHNTTNLTVNGDALDTIQDIAVTSSPTFSELTLTGLEYNHLVKTGDSSDTLESVLALSAFIGGTLNQINVTDNLDGSVTLSTPQDIALSSSPEFAGLTLTGFSGALSATAGVLSAGTLPVSVGGTGATSLTDHGLLLGSGTDPVTALGAASNGQIPIGSTGADPVLSTITGTANQVSVENGAGTITLSLASSIEITGATLSGLTASTLLQASAAKAIESIAGTGVITVAAGVPSYSTGTENYLPKWGSDNALGDSLVYDDGSGIVIGNTSASSLFEVYSASEHPIITITGAHATDYDPQIQFRTDSPSTTKWTLGVDSSDDVLTLKDGVGTSSPYFKFYVTSSSSYLELTAQRKLLLSGNGKIEWHGQTGDWVNIFQNVGSGGTDLCQFGFYGANDTLNYFYIGPSYNNSWMRLYSTYTKSDSPIGININPLTYNALADDLALYTSGHTGMTIVSGTSNLGSIYFADGDTGADTYRGIVEYRHGDNSLRFASNAAYGMALFATGILKVYGTAERATTVGTHHIDLFDGTAPAGTLANGISLYSSGGDFYAMDASGNANALCASGYVQPAAGYKAVDGSAGATGSFTTSDSKTVTVKDGIITNIA